MNTFGRALIVHQRISMDGGVPSQLLILRRTQSERGMLMTVLRPVMHIVETGMKHDIDADTPVDVSPA